MLSQQPSGIFYLQEFSAFLSSLQRDYNEGSVPWLTKIFDVPEVDTRVLRRETITLRKPCITILGASSPEWFAESYKASLLSGRSSGTSGRRRREGIGRPSPSGWHARRASGP